MQAEVEGILERRKNKVIAKLLGTKEAEIDSHIDPDVARRYRKLILDEINAYHDFALDVMREVDLDNTNINGAALEMLAAISEQLGVPVNG